MATEKTAMMVAFLLLLRSMSWGRGEGKELGKVGVGFRGHRLCHAPCPPQDPPRTLKIESACEG